MSAPSVDPGDLLDLKLMPAWVKEPSAREDYTNFEGEQPSDRPMRHDARPRGRDRNNRDRRSPSTPGRGNRDKPGNRDRNRDRGDRGRPEAPRRTEQRPVKPEEPLDLVVQFQPR